MTTAELPVRIPPGDLPKTVGLLVMCVRGVIAALLITLIAMNAPARPNTLLGHPRPDAPSRTSSPGNVWLTESGAWRPEMPELVSALGRVK